MNRIYLLALVGSALAFTPSTAKAQFPAYGQTGITVPGWIPTFAVGEIGLEQWYATRFFSAAPLRGHYFPVAYPAHGYTWHAWHRHLTPIWGCPTRAVVRVSVRRQVGSTGNPPSRPLMPMLATADHADPLRAVLIIRTPGDAEVWLGGTKVERAPGTEHRITTPELESGRTYAYDVRVRWGDREWEGEVALRPGERASLNVLSGKETQLTSTGG